MRSLLLASAALATFSMRTFAQEDSRPVENTVATAALRSGVDDARCDPRYPVAGEDFETPSCIANQNAVPLGKADSEWFDGHYLNDMAEAADPQIDIVGAADLADLPSVTIISAKIDPLHSEGMMLRDKLEEAGVEVAYQNWNGVTHEFFGIPAVGPEAQEAQGFAGAERLAAIASE